MQTNPSASLLSLQAKDRQADNICEYYHECSRTPNVQATILSSVCYLQVQNRVVYCLISIDIQIGYKLHDRIGMLNCDKLIAVCVSVFTHTQVNKSFINHKFAQVEYFLLATPNILYNLRDICARTNLSHRLCGHPIDNVCID